jgi:hypothetical protein
MDANRSSRLGVVALIIVAVGLVTLVIAASQAGPNIAVLKTWKPVEAQLINTTITNERNFSGIQLARTGNYLVTWTFRYYVGGAMHLATTTPGTHGTESQMMAWSKRFHPGQVITIHYRPGNPDVITAAQWDWITFSHAVRVACWGIGILILGIVMWKIARQSTPPGAHVKR